MEYAAEQEKLHHFIKKHPGDESCIKTAFYDGLNDNLYKWVMLDDVNRLDYISLKTKAEQAETQLKWMKERRGDSNQPFKKQKSHDGSW